MPNGANISRKAVLEVNRLRIDLDIDEQRVVLRMDLNTREVLEPLVCEIELSRRALHVVPEGNQSSVQVSEKVLERLGRLIKVLAHGFWRARSRSHLGGG